MGKKSPEIFVSSQELTNASNSVEWDLLLSRGTGTQQPANSRWERESLYQKFDPLVSQKPTLPTTLPPPPKFEEDFPIQLNNNSNQLKEVETLPTTTTFRHPAAKLEEKMDNRSTEFKEMEWDSNASNSVEWDLLLSRGTGSQQHANNRWDRESLYQKFDPLVSQKPTLPTNTFRPPAPKFEGENFPIQLNNNSSEPKEVEWDSNASNSLEWDLLMSRGMGSQQHVNNRPDRESLYQKFDPLASQKTTLPIVTSPPPAANLEEENVPIQMNNSEDENSPIQAQNNNEEENLLIEMIKREEEDFQIQMENKSSKLKELDESIAALSKKREIQEQENRVLEEYEVSIELLESQLENLGRQILNVEEDKVDIAQKRDYALEDLRHAEYAFSDLHSKYERVKELVNNFKKNEEILHARYEEMNMRVGNRDSKLKCLQNSVEEMFGRMQHDYETEIKAEELENQRIRAQVKKLEFRMATCEKDLAQKEKENAQLSQLCDDLIKGRQGKR